MPAQNSLHLPSPPTHLTAELRLLSLVEPGLSSGGGGGVRLLHDSLGETENEE